MYIGTYLHKLKLYNGGWIFSVELHYLDSKTLGQGSLDGYPKAHGIKTGLWQY